MDTFKAYSKIPIAEMGLTKFCERGRKKTSKIRDQFPPPPYPELIPEYASESTVKIVAERGL